MNKLKNDNSFNFLVTLWKVFVAENKMNKLPAISTF